MIDALIYDMGNVLVRWDPHALALAGSEDPADASVLEKALFASPDWIKGDLGLFGPEEMFAAARLRVPARLEPALRALCFQWPDWLEPLPGAADFVARANKRGLKGYLLSNASRRFPQALARCFPAFSLLDGWVVSAHEGVAKPDIRIYRRLLERYDLDPRRCFFIDDVPANLEGARRAGMECWLFDGDFSALERALLDRGVSLEVN